MSRIGIQPVELPKGVTVTTAARTVTVKGPKGEYLIRLRAGPFAAREDADRAHDVLKSAGLVAGTVAQRK